MTTSSFGRTLAPLALAAFMAGCSMMPSYERPEPPVSAQWPTNGLDDQGLQGGQGQALQQWQAFVEDANLRALIEQSLRNNRDLRVATLAIAQARAQYSLAGAGPFPTISAGVTGQRQSSGDDSSITSTYSGGLMVSAWEIDFFGRLASLTEAARAQFLSTAYAREAVQTSLIAGVASAWLNMQTATAMVELTEQTLTTRQESQKLTQLRFDNGVASALELRQVESLSASARATLAEQKRAKAQAINALTLLVGQEIDPQLLATSTLPLDIFADVPAGLPSDLLIRRPDIQQAEWSLRSANANIGAARAAFFPSISLTASAGSVSSHLSDLFSSGTFGWSIAPQALLPIFDAGRNRARLEGAEVARDIAVAQYEKAIQSAFSEVSDALAGRATLGEQLQAQQDLVTAEQKRYELSDLLYRSGVASFLDALDAQRSLFSAQQAVLQTRATLLANRVELYRVLGGGWDAEADLSTPAATSTAQEG
ncbi:efflux transporter outer membrane subunit [Lampropedia puyangensis]|uniref:Efflux transporter outer membrane subunit n=1 Tax=Lampropedia puyangensis TaxID=1330072 RepID=A0A4S8F504_9BURK|nr:efflux transporter outer membrane subunit [Lampropedia puyangensis]THU02518.1 efflux transporter outer membrane subunit [Lampropedia puyangensis]